MALRPTAPFAPVVISPGTGLNSLPRPLAPHVSGLPSPSVGTTIGQTRVPAPVLSGLPHATPIISASFGGQSYTPPTTLPRPTHPTQNHIGDHY